MGTCGTEPRGARPRREAFGCRAALGVPGECRLAISIKCATCGKRYQAADHMAGRRVRCKRCGTTFQLPAQPTSDDPFEQSQDAGADIPMSAAAPRAVF